MLENEDIGVEIEKNGKRETSILTIRVTPQLLNLVDKAVDASQGRYVSKADLVRNAIETFSRRVLEGDLHTEPKESESTKDDLEHEANVEEALELINELEDIGVEAVREFASETKAKALPKSVWSDDRVQTAMRKTLTDEIYPTGFWDDVRRFRKRKSREYTEILRKWLAVSRSTAKQLVEDPDFKGPEYEEWF